MNIKKDSQTMYKIRGTERRAVKNEYHRLKRFIKNFWYYESLEKDMCAIYNCVTESYPMSNVR